MNDADRLHRVESDLQRASTVIYLEGKSDPDILFALLGIARPTGDIHQDAYVVGLTQGPSGSAQVAALARVAGDNGLAGALGGGGIFGERSMSLDVITTRNNQRFQHERRAPVCLSFDPGRP